MNFEAQVREWLRDVTYKPGWGFSVLGTGDDSRPTEYRDSVGIRIRAELPNTSLFNFNVPATRLDRLHQLLTIPTIPVQMIFSVWQSEFESPSGQQRFMIRLWHAIQDLESHETNEWLRVDGQPYFHPHPSFIEQGAPLSSNRPARYEVTLTDA